MTYPRLMWLLSLECHCNTPRCSWVWQKKISLAVPGVGATRNGVWYNSTRLSFKCTSNAQEVLISAVRTVRGSRSNQDQTMYCINSQHILAWLPMKLTLPEKSIGFNLKLRSIYLYVEKIHLNPTKRWGLRRRRQAPRPVEHVVTCAGSACLACDPYQLSMRQPGGT